MKTMVIVGVGALGSHVAQFLRNEALLYLVDGDRVEQKNVAAQFHARQSVGKNKAVALSKQISFLFGHQTRFVPHLLTEDNIDEVIGGIWPDLVIDCTDNLAARLLVRGYCFRDRPPLLHGALDANGTYGKVAWTEHFVADSEPEEGAATCEGSEHLPFIALVAAYLARAAQRFLRDGVQVGYEINPRGAFST